MDDYDKKLKVFNYEKITIVQSHEEVFRDRKVLQAKISKQLEDVTVKTDKQNKTIEGLVKKIKQSKAFKEKNANVLSSVKGTTVFVWTNCVRSATC